MPAARIQVFGPLRLERDGVECPPPPGRKARGLLAYLLLQHGAEQPRDRLAELFWGESEDRRARQSLRQALSDLRRSLDGLGGYAVLSADERAVSLRVDCPVDLLAFLRDTEVVADAPLPRPPDEEEAAALARAVALGPPALLAESYDDWCIQAREWLAGRRLRALQALLARARADADHARVHQWGSELLALDPLQEDVHRALMEAAARAGDRAAALRQYALCVATLEREAGVAPEPETVSLYERIRAGALGPPAAAPEGTAALVGRGPELARLGEAVERAGGGHGRTLVISGPAGIGKTRLAAEAAALARAAGWLVVEAESGPSDRPEPYGGWLALLRALLLADDALAAALPEGALLALARLLPEGQRLLRASRRPEPTRADLFGGVVAALRAATRRRPLLAVLDDLHWADPDTVLLFGHVARAAPSMPLLLIGTRRDFAGEGSPLALTSAALEGEGLLESMTLAPLTPAGVQTLLGILSGNDELAASLAAAAFAETEGNPLHLGELWRAMQGQGRLERDAGGRWRWRGGLFGARERLPLPARVRATVAGRLATLDPAAREALTLGAVLGVPWDAALLAAIAGGEADAWEESLAQAARRGLLRRTGAGYSFAHDVIRETVERETESAALPGLHLRAGETLERLHADDPEPVAARLARHFLLAGPRGVGRAYRYSLLAARRGRALFAYQQAIERFRLALDYAEGGLVSDPRAVAELRLELAESLARAGRMEEVVATAAPALAVLDEQAPPEDAVAARVRLASLFDANVDPATVLRYTDEAQQRLGATDPALAAELLKQQAYARERQGQIDGLPAAAAALAELARRTGSERVAAIGLHTEGLYLANYSLDQVACAELRLQARAVYERAGDPFLAAECLGDAVDSLVRIGEARRARPLAEEALAAARGLQSAVTALNTFPPVMELLLTAGEFEALDALLDELQPYLTPPLPSGRGLQLFCVTGVADMWRGRPVRDLTAAAGSTDPNVFREVHFILQVWAAMNAGRSQEARALLDRVAALVPSEGQGMRWCVNVLPLVHNYAALGCPAEARRWLPALARHAAFQVPGAQVRLDLARIYLQSGDLDAADRLLAEAAAVYEAEGLRPFLAQAELERANVRISRGDPAAARPHLDRAEATFEALGMTPSLARVRAARRGAVLLPLI